jgi:hypothetical protein
MPQVHSEEEKITREALCRFFEWASRFRGEVQQRAKELAKSKDGLITSDLLNEAVRSACEELAREISTPVLDHHQGGGKHVA